MNAYYRRPGIAEKVRQRTRHYREDHLSEVRAADRARGFRRYDDLKHRARLAVTHAIERGTLVREPCEACGREPAQAHHDDYSKPLDVRWLCSTCHGIEHRKIA
jgi:ribosomal protein S27AE